jgi:hypothetical protein
MVSPRNCVYPYHTVRGEGGVDTKRGASIRSGGLPSCTFALRRASVQIVRLGPPTLTVRCYFGISRRTFFAAGDTHRTTPALYIGRRRLPDPQPHAARPLHTPNAVEMSRQIDCWRSLCAMTPRWSDWSIRMAEPDDSGRYGRRGRPLSPWWTTASEHVALWPIGRPVGSASFLDSWRG